MNNIDYIYNNKLKYEIYPKKDNGCYVLLDDFKDIKYAYSFGISFMVQFDDELTKRDIDVYMYDHTINNLPYNKTKFHC